MFTNDHPPPPKKRKRNKKRKHSYQLNIVNNPESSTGMLMTITQKRGRKGRAVMTEGDNSEHC